MNMVRMRTDFTAYGYNKDRCDRIIGIEVNLRCFYILLRLSTNLQVTADFQSGQQSH